jgi:mono/diheme cytochrome c family protein
MTRRDPILAAVFAGLVTVGSAALAIAQEQSSAANKPAVNAAAASGARSSGSASKSKAEEAEERALRIDGEKRFRINCGRCHMAPHKFPPRVMAAAVRHMRVRAMVTDEDMRVILHYMTR